MTLSLVRALGARDRRVAVPSDRVFVPRRLPGAPSIDTRIVFSPTVAFLQAGKCFIYLGRRDNRGAVT
jgi:hypothetical protein